MDRVVSLHLNGGLLGAKSTAADVAKLFGALLSYIADQQAGPGLCKFSWLHILPNKAFAFLSIPVAKACIRSFNSPLPSKFNIEIYATPRSLKCASACVLLPAAGSEHVREHNTVTAAIARSIKAYQHGFDETALSQIIRQGHLAAAFEVRKSSCACVF